MEVLFFNSIKNRNNIFNLDDYKDIRFSNEIPGATKRRLRRIPGEDSISAIVKDKDEILGVFISSTNTWSGLKTIFCNGILVKRNLLNRSYIEIIQPLIDCVMDNAKKLEYENLLIESDTGNKDIENLFKGYNKVHSRTLINYITPRDNLYNSTKGMIKKTERNNFIITEGDINNLTPYHSFMDTRPGWLTSNASMSKENGDKLITVKTSFGTVSAIAIFNPESGIISRIATMPLSRGTGFASALLEYIATHSKCQNIAMVDINKKNEDARTFLIHRGFKEILIKDEFTYSLTSN